MKYIMVLNDGETFTNLEGCAIMGVPDDADSEAIEALLDGESHNDPAVVVTFDVNASGEIDIIESSGDFRPLLDKDDGFILEPASPPFSEGPPRAHS